MNVRAAAAPDQSQAHGGQPPHNGQAAAQPRIWGLTVQQLHDAYWLSRGVQCVRLGRVARLEVADLYLLLRPDQLVVFELDALLNRLIWQGASVTAVHVVPEPAGYYESAVTDEAGNVKRIERRYRAAPKPRGRVYLTERMALAAAWAGAESGRDWRRALRRSFPAPLVARVRCHGRSIYGHDVSENGQFLTDLVERWPDPERALKGLDVLQNGVRIRRGDPRPATTIVGPVWIGARSSPLDDASCIVGPACLPDQVRHEHARSSVEVRPMSDVDAPQRRNGMPQSRRQPRRFSLYPVAKRTLDITVSTAVLMALMPVMVIIAAAIVINDGFPVLFRHRRQSRHGKPFDCLKFRTMYNNAEQMVAELKAKNICDGPQVHIENDPRATRVGRVLRKLHLDELPQFWNVLVGDMSLVGPRPSPDAENRICPAWRELRLSVRPGITGLWQINRTREPGRDFQEWIRYDVQYVRTATFWLDICICMRTVLLIVNGRRKQ